MVNTVVAFVHLGALLGALAYAVVSLVHGNVPRFGLIVILLAIYYIFLLHPGVKKEMARRRSLKKESLKVK